MMMRRALTTLCLLLLTDVAFGQHDAQAHQVQLRTGTAILKLTPSLRNPAGTLDPLAYRSSAWGDATSLRLYLIAYDADDEALVADVEQGAAPLAPPPSGVSRSALLSALRSRGASVLSYIPDATLLVAATPDTMAELAAEMGAKMAEYGHEHCIAPELAPLLAPPAAASQAPQQRHRRNLRARLEPAAVLDESASAERSALLGGMSRFNPRTVAGGAAHDARRRRLVEGTAVSPMYELKVELLPGLPVAALEAAAEDWPAALAAAASRNSGNAAGECMPIVVAQSSAAAGGGDGVCSSNCWLQVFLCEADLAAGVRWLAVQPVVRWVAPGLRMMRHNAASSILLQTGDLTLSEYQNPTSPTTEAADRPYRAAGLDGTGEIVGLGDTGVDLDSCYFADPRVNATSYAGLLTDYPPRYRPDDHRKLAQYYMVPGALFGDDPSVEWGAGHGTHTAGTVGGAILASSDPYGPYVTDAATGMAPRAKLSIVDMNVPPTLTFESVWNKETFITPPQPLDTEYLPLHTAVNANIISDAWGAQLNVYDSNAQAYDRFLWNNPDVVSFVAVGNNGTQALTPGGTIGTPASAKSVVAVGQGERIPAAAQATRNTIVVRAFKGTSTTESWRRTIWPMEAFFQPKLLDVIAPGTTVPIVLATPNDGCSALTNAPASVAGAVVLVKRGTCLFTVKEQNVKNAGGLAVIFLNNVALMITDPPTADDSLNMPVSMLTKGLGDALLGNITAGFTLVASNLPTNLTITSVSVSSSYGPMSDGRIKPDIIAPGTSIISASADGGVTDDTCSPAQRNLTGTSMATALAAGNAALIRQYFRTGFYPVGNPANISAAAPFLPSGMLIKATVIAGAKSLRGGTAQSLGITLGAGPDGHQGWGRLNLAGALPLPRVTNARMKLQVVDRGEMTTTGQTVSFTGITATGTGAVTVVLAWYDYPADLNAAVQLVNDLDLTVTVGATATTAAYTSYGNNAEKAATPVADRRNTVERVQLALPPAGAPLTITVAAARIGSDGISPLPQRFAVAVVGQFTGTLATPLNPDWAQQQARMV